MDSHRARAQGGGLAGLAVHCRGHAGRDPRSAWRPLSLAGRDKVNQIARCRAGCAALPCRAQPMTPLRRGRGRLRADDDARAAPSGRSARGHAARSAPSPRCARAAKCFAEEAPTPLGSCAEPAKFADGVPSTLHRRTCIGQRCPPRLRAGARAAASPARAPQALANLREGELEPKPSAGERRMLE